MPIVWRRISVFVSFAIALTLAVWLPSYGFGWASSMAIALATFIVVPFVISQLCAAFILVRAQKMTSLLRMSPAGCIPPRCRREGYYHY